MKRNKLYIGTALLAGLFLGWLFFHSSSTRKDNQEQISEAGKETIWTCAMHPQIRMKEPGKCPICGMELIPLNQNEVKVDSGAIHLSKEAAELANVMTSVVTKQKPVKEIRLFGKIQADERRIQSQVAHISGRIEKLQVNFTGENVSKGQALAVVYSPELITIQQEFLEAVKSKQSQPQIYAAAVEKLKQLRLSNNQIESIELSGSVLNTIEIVSDVSGIVLSRRINVGDYISQGSILYDIADLSNVWVLFDAYESDLAYLNINDVVSFSVQALPGKMLTGKISFIDPVIDPVTRVSKVRVEIQNQEGKLKPEMFVTGTVQSGLSDFTEKIVVPQSAVLWTGKRSIVYVKQTGTNEPVFKLREIELGSMLGNSYVVVSGLNEGEEIVTQGAFSVDAAAQLEGKPSMMNVSEKENIAVSRNTVEIEKKETIFKVSGNCELCKERIEKAANSVEGVNSAEWNVKTKQLRVEYNSMETSSENIQKAIANVGHDTELFKADNAVYNQLPECCRYRN
jgi:Cu(I)/Ag(I) efflux system membrane fusion protein